MLIYDQGDTCMVSINNASKTRVLTMIEEKVHTYGLTEDVHVYC